MVAISSVQPDSAILQSMVQNTVIKLDQIKNILYLGVKANVPRAVPEAHQIDTFA
ncbi:hypothetical protein LCGC14_2700400 [marine sediment metagenome]|uniref:Uncharacterized protein n=1 Tax=marine sediment metagenome TaxID=412755 RepID=A0A0F8ZG01_9ZZZZ